MLFAMSIEPRVSAIQVWCSNLWANLTFAYAFETLWSLILLNYISPRIKWCAGKRQIQMLASTRQARSEIRALIRPEWHETYCWCNFCFHVLKLLKQKSKIVLHCFLLLIANISLQHEWGINIFILLFQWDLDERYRKSSRRNPWQPEIGRHIVTKEISSFNKWQ